MRQEGGCYISNGYANGVEKASAALRNALNHPLLEEIPLRDAKGMVVKFSGALNLAEVQDAIKKLKENVSPDAEVITALEENDLFEDQVQVMVLVTGIGAIPVQEQVLANHHTAEEINIAVPELAPKSLMAGYTPADASPDELEVPAFIRRGYNQVAHAFS